MAVHAFFLWLAVSAVLAAVAGLGARAWEAAIERRALDLLAQRTEAMRQALLWYADRSHWRREHTLGRHWRNSPAAADRGTQARHALDAAGIAHTDRPASARVRAQRLTAPAPAGQAVRGPQQ